MTLDSIDQVLQRTLATKPESETVAREASQSFLAEIGTSAANQGKSIYNAVAQISDGAGIHLPKAKLTEQAEAPMMSGRWWCQEAGSLAVTLPLVLLTHKAVSASTGRLAAGAAESATARAFTMTPEKLALTRLGATGAIFEGTFKSSSADDSLLWGRTKGAIEGGTGFLAMGLASNKIGAMLGRHAIEGEAVNFSSRLARVALPGLGGGAAYGLTETQSKSLLDHARPAGLGTTMDAMAKGAILGTALSSFGMFRSEAPVVANPLRVSIQKGELSRNVMSTTSGESVLNGLKQDVNLKGSVRDDLVTKANQDFSEGSRLARSGDHGGALPKLIQSLAGLVKVRGAEDPSVAPVLSEISRSDMYTGNTARAVQSMESALKINSKQYGDASPQVASSYDQLSAIYSRGGDFARAAEAMEKAVAAQQAAHEAGKLGVRSSENFTVNIREMMNELANLYQQAGNADKAGQVRKAMPAAPEVVPYLREQ